MQALFNAVPVVIAADQKMLMIKMVPETTRPMDPNTIAIIANTFASATVSSRCVDFKQT